MLSRLRNLVWIVLLASAAGFAQTASLTGVYNGSNSLPLAGGSVTFKLMNCGGTPTAGSSAYSFTLNGAGSVASGSVELNSANGCVWTSYYQVWARDSAGALNWKRNFVINSTPFNITTASVLTVLPTATGGGTGGGTGPTGPTGPTGSTGAAGAAATVAAGTTTTLAPGTPATVVNVGTTSAAVFNFGIPQGTPGTGGSGGGGSYPSGTGIVVYGDSRVAVTGNNTTGLMTCGYNGLAITASSVTSGVGTFTASQAQSIGDAITLYGFTGAGAALNGQRVTILSGGFSTTQFEANVTGSMSGATGAGLYGCTFLPSTLLANSSLLPSSSTVNLQAVGNATVAMLISNYTTLVHPLSPAVTGKPGILILQAGVGDIISSGGQVTTVETNLQTLWALAHSDGFQVMSESLIPHTGNIYNGSTEADILAVNLWMRGQGPQNNPPAAGKYWDTFADVAQDLANDSDPNLFLPSQHLTDQGNGYVFNNISSNLLAKGTAAQGTAFCYYTQGCPNLTAANTFTQGQVAPSWVAQLAPFNGPYIGYGIQATTNTLPTTFVGNGPFIGYALDSIRMPYFLGTAGMEQIHSSYYSTCWNGVGDNGAGPTNNPGVVGLSEDQTVSTQINVGNCLFGDKSAGLGFAYQIGPATAPTGSCPVNGRWVLAQDGTATRCLGGTWTAFGASGSGSGSGGALTQIAQIVVSGSSTTTINFGSIPATYDSLEVQFVGTMSSGSNNDFLEMQLNGDTAADYFWSHIEGGSLAVSNYNSTSDTKLNVALINGNTAQPAVMTLDMPGYASTVLQKTFSSTGTFQNGPGNSALSLFGGTWTSTAAVNAISLFNHGGSYFIAGDVVTLYGKSSGGGGSGGGSGGSGGSGSWTNIGSLVTWGGCTYASGTCTVPGTGDSTLIITSIPGTYSNIKVVGVVNTTSAYGPGQALTVQFNDDGGSNYDYSIWQTNPGGTGATTHSNTNSFGLGGVSGSSVANSSTIFELSCPQYSNTAALFYHQCQGIASQAYAGGVNLETFSGQWHSFAAITKFGFAVAGNYWTNGSTLQIFGQN